PGSSERPSRSGATKAAPAACYRWRRRQLPVQLCATCHDAASPLLPAVRQRTKRATAAPPTANDLSSGVRIPFSHVSSVSEVQIIGPNGKAEGGGRKAPI